MTETHEVHLIVTVRNDISDAYLTDTLGETMRMLEGIEDGEAGAEPGCVGLVPDPDDPGRYAWRLEGLSGQ